MSFRTITRPVCILAMLLVLAACQVSEQPQPPAIAAAQTGIGEQSGLSRRPSSVIEPPAEIQTEVETVEDYASAWERVRAGFKLQQHYQHPEVDAQLANYRANQRLFDLVSARAEPFLFQIIEEIEDRDLPMELALLPIVESTYNPQAHSSENAVGLWQILGNTGRDLGLQQDWWYDARRDPVEATIAALDYLQTLHQQFDQDWMITLAAYNTGPGNVRRALRRVNDAPANFWSLRLASETRYHVPRLLALARIVQEPDLFEVDLPVIPNQSTITRVDIGSQIDLFRVAGMLEMEESELRALNPGYLQWATHPESPQSINIPIEKQAQLINGLASLDRSEFVTWEHYQIRPGDNLITIARRLNTTVDVLRVVNELPGSRIIAGESLLIPRGSGAQDYQSLSRPVVSNSENQPVPESYTIRSGDNLWLIARRFDLRSREIAAWNNIAIDATLFPGQILDLSFAHTETSTAARSGGVGSQNNPVYTVIRGDSPSRIAKMFDIELTDFLLWNNLSNKSVIYPGQQLYIAPEQQRLN